MRANRAYIASLGTTTVMIASAVLLLAVVSTLVAFNGWPGASIARDVGSLVVKEPDASLRVSGPAQLVADALPASADVASEPAPTGPAATAAAERARRRCRGVSAAAGIGGGGGEVTPTGPPAITTDATRSRVDPADGVPTARAPRRPDQGVGETADGVTAGLGRSRGTTTASATPSRASPAASARPSASSARSSGTRVSRPAARSTASCRAPARRSTAALRAPANASTAWSATPAQPSTAYSAKKP